MKIWISVLVFCLVSLCHGLSTGSSGSYGGDGQCDMVGVQKCTAGITLLSFESNDLQAACVMSRTSHTCLEPFKADCESDSTFQAIMAGFAKLGNGQCDLVGVQKCIAVITLPSFDQIDLQAACAIQTCLQPFKADCNSESTFQAIMAGFAELGQLCGGSSGSSGGDGQCDMTGVGKCMKDVQLPFPDTKDLQTTCASFNEVGTCIKRYDSDCASVQAFQRSKVAIDAVAPFCAGGAACNPMKCYTDAELDIIGSSIPNLTCDVAQQVKTCMDKMTTACEGNILYRTFVQFLQSGAKACS
ncbi:uncharacterized protein LOC125663457 isoform X2 [Ostrea edulis]|uniref:uncharacterized protein LOC125663457 isoform X2 n=1 Tax=Ostrea edulis TaxID=37623 RepID=UPI0024AF9764|nr:uncharacterized protein LOC125663457 isoform X2 [Ostrea edulis]